MQIQLKGVLLIFLIVGHEANRVNLHIGLHNTVNELEKRSVQSVFSNETQEFERWGCNMDVVVRAAYGGGGKSTKKMDIRVGKEAILNGVVPIGHKKRSGCDVSYQLLCPSSSKLLTLRKQAPPCDKAPESCRKSTLLACGEHEDVDFGLFTRWRTTTASPSLVQAGLFNFDPSFIEEFAGGVALDPSAKVFFTPTSQSCAQAKGELDAQKAKLEEALSNFADPDKDDIAGFKKRTALLKPFQRAHASYEKMQCGTDEPVIPEDFKDSVIAKLRETWLAAYAQVNNEAAEARFDETVEYMKKIADQDPTLADLVKAAKILEGRETEETEEVDADEINIDGDDIPPEREEQLEKVLAGDATALVQLREGQLTTRQTGPDATALASGVVIVAVFIWMCVVFFHVVYFLFICALIISLGILSVNAIAALAKR